MSNLVHRRRRCARIVIYMILCLEGSTPEDRYLTRRRISLWLQGSLFCTANGSYFVLWLSVCQQQTRQVGRFRQVSLLAWMNITSGCKGVSLGKATNFLIYFLHKRIRSIRPIRVRRRDLSCGVLPSRQLHHIELY